MRHFLILIRIDYMRLSRLTIELIISTVIVSSVETVILINLGIIKPLTLEQFMILVIALDIADLIMAVAIEDTLIRTKHHVKRIFGIKPKRKHGIIRI
jgi:hypothetical protein